MQTRTKINWDHPNMIIWLIVLLGIAAIVLMSCQEEVVLPKERKQEPKTETPTKPKRCGNEQL